MWCREQEWIRRAIRFRGSRNANFDTCRYILYAASIKDLFFSSIFTEICARLHSDYIRAIYPALARKDLAAPLPHAFLRVLLGYVLRMCGARLAIWQFNVRLNADRLGFVWARNIYVRLLKRKSGIEYIEKWFNALAMLICHAVSSRQYCNIPDFFFSL